MLGNLVRLATTIQPQPDPASSSPFTPAPAPVLPPGPGPGDPADAIRLVAPGKWSRKADQGLRDRLEAALRGGLAEAGVRLDDRRVAASVAAVPLAASVDVANDLRFALLMNDWTLREVETLAAALRGGLTQAQAGLTADQVDLVVRAVLRSVVPTHLAPGVAPDRPRIEP